MEKRFSAGSRGAEATGLAAACSGRSRLSRRLLAQALRQPRPLLKQGDRWSGATADLIDKLRCSMLTG